MTTGREIDRGAGWKPATHAEGTTGFSRRRFLAAGVLLASPLHAATTSTLPEPVECIAPAKPGGGFDVTCRVVRQALLEARLAKAVTISFMPGGIGAVAFNTIAAQRQAEDGTLVAFSGGTLLNIAQQKFGRFNENDVRWLAGIGTDYGVIVVGRDAPYQSLDALLSEVRANPRKIAFGGGGTVGSQDWLKIALLARSAGIGFKTIRFVAFEGGGDALAALQSGHIQAYSGDASEVAQLIVRKAPLRVLAVLSEQRLPGMLADVPTAREQGYEIDWPIIRGLYMGPRVRDSEYHAWVDAFNRVLASREFARLREVSGLFPYARTGTDFEAAVRQQIKRYRELTEGFALTRR